MNRPRVRQSTHICGRIVMRPYGAELRFPRRGGNLPPAVMRPCRTDGRENPFRHPPRGGSADATSPVGGGKIPAVGDDTPGGPKNKKPAGEKSLSGRFYNS